LIKHSWPVSEHYFQCIDVYIVRVLIQLCNMNFYYVVMVSCFQLFVLCFSLKVILVRCLYYCQY